MQIAEATEKDGLYRLMKAVAKSERLVAEDIMREAGYMLPQSNNAHELLEELIAKSPDGFPVETAKKLLNMIPNNEKTWKELGYKSKKAYNEYLDDIYDDLRHGYI